MTAKFWRSRTRRLTATAHASHTLPIRVLKRDPKRSRRDLAICVKMNAQTRLFIEQFVSKTQSKDRRQRRATFEASCENENYSHQLASRYKHTQHRENHSSVCDLQTRRIERQYSQRICRRTIQANNKHAIDVITTNPTSNTLNILGQADI